MNVLVIFTNTNRMLAPVPLGASLVASRLRHDGYHVRFVDLMFAKSPANAAAQAAREFQPDLVCYSIRNVDNQSSTEFVDPMPTINNDRVQSRITSLRGALQPRRRHYPAGAGDHSLC